MTTLASAASLCLLAPNSAPGQTGNKRRIPKKALNSDTAFIVSLCLSAPPKEEKLFLAGYLGTCETLTLD